jgi:large subunit ribosomal protein L24
MHIKKGDQIYIMTGKDKGKTGKVLRALPKDGRVIVEGMNVRKIHQKPTRGGEKGKTVEKSFSIHASNVRLADKAAKKVKAPKAAKAKKAAK